MCNSLPLSCDYLSRGSYSKIDPCLSPKSSDARNLHDLLKKISPGLKNNAADVVASLLAYALENSNPKISDTSFPSFGSLLSSGSNISLDSACRKSLLGSSAFLPDCSFAEGKRKRADYVLDNVAQYQEDFSADTAAWDGVNVNCIWSRACSPLSNENVRQNQRVLQLEALNLSKRRKWTQEEDDRLEEGVKLHGIPNWSLIAQHVGTREGKMCAQRWRYYMRPEIKVVKRGKWSKQEDDRLRQIVSTHDHKTERTWELASKSMDFTRNIIQCRARWKNYLDPSLRLEPWTAEEDEHLLYLHADFGNSWKKFSSTSTLVGRSPQRIKRRYAQLTKRKRQRKSA